MQVFVRAKICPDPCKRGLSVQVWDLKAGQLFDRHGSIFVWTRVNTRTVQLFAQIARLYWLWPGTKCSDWSKLCTDPCKHQCNRIYTDPCKQAVQEQYSSVQKFARTRVNGAYSLLSIFNYMRKCTSCRNNTKLENPGPTLPRYLGLLFICVLLFYLRFTFLFVFYFFICVFNLTFHFFLFFFLIFVFFFFFFFFFCFPLWLY